MSNDCSFAIAERVGRWCIVLGLRRNVVARHDKRSQDRVLELHWFPPL